MAILKNNNSQTIVSRTVSIRIEFNCMHRCNDNNENKNNNKYLQHETASAGRDNELHVHGLHITL